MAFDMAHQAGGGVSGELRTVSSLSTNVLNDLKRIYARHASNGSTWTAQDTARFLKDTQHIDSDGPNPNDPALPAATAWKFDDLVRYMTSSAANIVAPPTPVDLSYPLSAYFVSTSHNTYLTGNQLTSNSDVKAYKDVLLRGCRCIEIDVWDGKEFDSSSESSISSSDDEVAAAEQKRKKVKVIKEKLPRSLVDKLDQTTLGKKVQDVYVGPAAPAATPAGTGEGERLEKNNPAASTTGLPPGNKPPVGVVEPLVFHGLTFTSDIGFRDVCRVIRENAFVASDLPVIASLEVHCSPEQQEVMVVIMKEEWANYMLPEPEGDVAELPSLGELKHKIIVKVKYAPPPGKPDTAACSPSEAMSRATTESSGPPASVDGPPKPKNHPKIIQALSKLGIYTRGVKFKSLTQPEAKMPTHVFSLSENDLISVHKESARELFEHNRKFLMRAYPAGKRVWSSNLDPGVFWRKGVQMVALNWQSWDEGMMLNEAMFAGTGGYVLKPRGYRPNDPPPSSSPTTNPQATAVRHDTMNLTITAMSAQNLPLPPDETPSSFKPYLKVEVHVEEANERHGTDLPQQGRQKGGEYKAKSKVHKGCEPNFKEEVLTFYGIPGVVPELSFVRFRIKDSSLSKDKLAAWACVRVDLLRDGLHFLHLLDAQGMKTEGVLLLWVTKELY